jgi:hypothetical protein
MDLLPVSERYTRVVTYDEQAPHRWGFDEEEDIVTAIAVWKDPSTGDRLFVALGEDGKVDFQEDDAHIREQIVGSGLWNPHANGWGYMSALKQIGTHLYAAGGAGQVYKRVGPDQWMHMDAGLLQAPDVSERLLPRAIDGPHEAAIYLLGGISAIGVPPFLFFWNGQHWTRLPLPEVAERLTGIHVESEQCIWLCGANGTLLRGNAAEGFTSLATVDDNQLFLSLCLYRERIVLASNIGLFYYDPAQPQQGIRKLTTTLQPDVQDANIVEAVEGVLWSIGPKDIVRHTEKGWERIDHPDNPPIR